MAKQNSFRSSLREHRLLKGWSQDELARLSGLSRAGVGAIETGRLIPSTAAALALAACLDCKVEDLFRLHETGDETPLWAWAPAGEPCRYWRAEVGGRTRLYPAEATMTGFIPHDGVYEGGSGRDRERVHASRTLLMAGCDPAAGLLVDELARNAGVRLIALRRSSRAALQLLAQGLVHIAGVHLSGADRPSGNAQAVRETVGVGCKLLRVARWEEGVAFAASCGISSIREASRPEVRWVGREAGSGARQCQDEILEGRRPPRRLASDHRGVAEAVRQGWADAGVCLRLASEEAGLGFLPVRYEDYDLCFQGSLEGDARIQALLQSLHSPSLRMALGELPGYDSRETGGLQSID